jgi:hypothetical protein
MNIKEKFENELMAIESSIVDVFRSEPNLLDSQVNRAISSMVIIFKSKIKGRIIEKPKFDGLDLLVFDALDAAVNALLNTNSNLTDDDFLQCFKIVAKSIPRWTKQLGRQGYLKFVSQYF